MKSTNRFINVLYLPPNYTRNFGDRAICDVLFANFDNYLFLYEQHNYLKVLHNNDVSGLKFRNLNQFISYLERHHYSVKSIYVIGTDIMDGKYGLKKPIEKLDMLAHFASKEAKSFLINFSLIDSKLSPRVLQKLSLGKNLGVNYLARNKKTISTLQSFDIKSEFLPDLAISLFPEKGDLGSFKAIKSKHGGKIAISPSIHADNIESEIFWIESVLKIALDANWKIDFLASVPKQFPRRSDTSFIGSMLSSIYDSNLNNNINIVEHVSEIKRSILQSDLVIASRLHVALYALCNSKPVLGGYPAKLNPFFDDFGVGANCPANSEALVNMARSHIGGSKLVQISPQYLVDNMKKKVDEFLNYG